ncbi:MAG: BrnT family toxin [Fibrobacterota bacterium]
MNYDFEWDLNKAKSNRQKHGISFEQAAIVFRDPRLVSVFDETHSNIEDRWITLGISAGGGLLVVHHTFEEINDNKIRIRIFSSRKATKNETRQYGE